MKKLFKEKPQKAAFCVGLFFVTLLTLVGVGSSFLYKDLTDKDSNVLVIVGSEKITKLDLTRKAYGVDLSGDLSDPNLIDKKGLDEETKKSFLEALIRESVVRQTAATMQVEVTEEEVQTKTKANPDYAKLSKEQLDVLKLSSKNLLLEEKLKNSVLTVKKGQYLNIRFDRHLVDAPDSFSAEKKAAWEAGKAENSKNDRAYADSLKDEIYQSLLAGKTSFEQAATRIDSDKTLDYENWENTIGDQTIEFDTSNNAVGFKISDDPNFKKALTKTTAGEIAEPFLKKLDYSEKSDGSQKIDSMWVILKVTEEKAGETTDFELWLKEKSDSLGVNKLTNKYSVLEMLTEKALAFSNSECSSGRSGETSTHPGDVIAQAKTEFADGSAAQFHNDAHFYTRPGLEGNDYSGCPAPDSGETNTVKMSDIMTWETDATLFYYTENSNDNGCMYRFASIASDTINQCCGGSHNPHQYRFRNMKGAYPYNHGVWNHWHSAYSNGDDWTAATDFTSKQNGVSDNFTRNVVNGETLYIRAWFKIPANIPPVVSQTSPANEARFQVTDTTNSIAIKAIATDANNDTVRFRVGYQKSTDNGSTWGSETFLPSTTTFYGPAAQSTTERGLVGLNPSTLGEGKYRWRVIAVDEHDANSGWSGFRYFYVDNPEVPAAPTLSCSVEPESGPIPFVVDVIASYTGLGTDPTFTWNMGNGVVLNRGGSFTYTYNRAETTGYTVTASNPDYNSGAAVTCSPTPVRPINPGGGGGEVAP